MKSMGDEVSYQRSWLRKYSKYDRKLLDYQAVTLDLSTNTITIIYTQQAVMNSNHLYGQFNTAY